MKTKLLVIGFIVAAAAVVCGGLFGACTGRGGENIFEHQGDIGAVKTAGSVVFEPADGSYTLTGSGTNMWGPSDEFFMTWRSVTGDFELSADVAFEGEGVNAHRKLGLIIRDGLAPGAAYADVAVHGDGLVSLQYRPTQGAETQEVIGQPSGSVLPGRVSLERRGDRLVMRISERTAARNDFENGRADAHDLWNGAAGGEVELSLPETCLVGLFVCSHDADVVETGRFTNVRFAQ